MKTLWEKEKLLVISDFIFSPQCFYIESKNIVCKLFHFGRVKNLSFEKGLIYIIWHSEGILTNTAHNFYFFNAIANILF